VPGAQHAQPDLLIDGQRRRGGGGDPCEPWRDARALPAGHRRDELRAVVEGLAHDQRALVLDREQPVGDDRAHLLLDGVDGRAPGAHVQRAEPRAVGHDRRPRREVDELLDGGGLAALAVTPLHGGPSVRP
jgi:hypothetical protein